MNTDTAALVAKWTVLVTLVWPLQYLLAVPAVLVLRAARVLLKAASTVGILGVLLLFLPIIGWALLFLLVWMKRRSDRRHEELLAALTGPTEAQAEEGGTSILSPWALSWVQ